MNPHAHPRLSALLHAGFCGPVPGRLARWFGAKPVHHKWRVARRAELGDAGALGRVYELRVVCERCGTRHATHAIDALLWSLGIELPEVAREAKES